MGSPVQSEAEVMNMALDLLIEAPITSPTDDRPVARWMRRNYPTIRDALIRRHPWNFAIERRQLAADAAGPEYGWTYRYKLPADVIRVLPLTANGEFNGDPVPHILEAGYVLTNKAGPLKVRLLVRVNEPARFDPLFTNALVHLLAMKAAHWMTGKQSFVQLLQGPARDAMNDAQLIDSLEGTPEDPADNDILNAR